VQVLPVRRDATRSPAGLLRGAHIREPGATVHGAHHAVLCDAHRADLRSAHFAVLRGAHRACVHLPAHPVLAQGDAGTAVGIRVPAYPASAKGEAGAAATGEDVMACGLLLRDGVAQRPNVTKETRC